MKKNDIEFFKELLLSRKEQVLKNIDGTTQEIRDMDISDARDDADLASLNISSFIGQALSVQQSKELLEIEYALGKIDNGTYGICEMCEEEISIQRLKIKPHAKYCIICRGIVEQTKNKRSL
ncbi:MAG: RNA polymerase-binding protein DksA [Campylobacteraceae bacterium]|nr:RNA polymerase-binding protein DksA [Campylobacteraceae bacterium]